MIKHLNDKNGIRDVSLIFDEDFDKTAEIKVVTHYYDNVVGAYVLKIKKRYKKTLKECETLEEFKKIENLYGTILCFLNYYEFLL